MIGPHKFSFGCDGLIYGEFYLDLQFLPSKVSPFFDILALLNGGIREFENRNGYWFISWAGLLHFAFLTDNLDEYHARWRSAHYEYQHIMERNRDNGWF
jgi:hypothetical protein